MGASLLALAKSIYYKYVQLVQGAITLTSITIILLFNFEKKRLIRLSVSSKLQN